MGTGSPLNTYRPPPPVPGDFYPLVSSSPAYRNAILPSFVCVLSCNRKSNTPRNLFLVNRYQVPELIDIVLQDRRFHLSKYATYNRRTDPSDKSMIVKDGYQWRKYEQKVTRIGYYLHACCVLV
ncbi:hypothetical protein L2E82_06230 [Cichorium intybus]|uniref:Uncharacterized protein n=1 Tax=Cichorium intybus TaxID=13427 RepID=A0ACB9H904_CICIN|nr:hypothetical protein L2E82_06230 [Cichorium intybus]